MKERNIGLVAIAFYIILIVGEVRCIYKAVKCNWNPTGKAEIIYTASACTGIGCIVGWIDIEDE